jgi:hypothetical protein
MGLDVKTLQRMAGEIHCARRRIREALFRIENDEDKLFFEKCYRFELESFKQFEAFYRLETPSFLESLRQGDHEAVADTLIFLEADPYCFRSGYIKKKLCSALKKTPLDRSERKRVRDIITARLSTLRPVSFSDFAKLGCFLYTPGFHARVRKQQVPALPCLLKRKKDFLRRLDEEAQRRQKFFSAPEHPLPPAGSSARGCVKRVFSIWNRILACLFFPFRPSG